MVIEDYHSPIQAVDVERCALEHAPVAPLGARGVGARGRGGRGVGAREAGAREVGIREVGTRFNSLLQRVTHRQAAFDAVRHFTLEQNLAAAPAGNDPRLHLTLRRVAGAGLRCDEGKYKHANDKSKRSNNAYKKTRISAGLHRYGKRANLDGMQKARAIELLGGTVTAAAQAIGVTPSAVTQWPDELPARIEDRVLAALARKHLPPAVLGAPEPEPAADEPTMDRRHSDLRLEPNGHVACGTPPNEERRHGDKA